MNTDWRTPENIIHSPANDLPDKIEVEIEGKVWILARYKNKYMRSESLFTLLKP